MNILHRKKYVLGTILLIAVGHTAARTTRAAAGQAEEVNDLDVAELANQLEKIPEIGPYLKELLDKIGESLMVVSQLLNSVIARMLGGSLPCEMGPKEITCSGTSKEGGVFGIVEDLLDQLIIPDVMKRLMLDTIKRTVNPVVDTLFGGLPLPKTKI